ncbi:FISUMP domain-containing protein, partial [Methanoculleus sp.]|uniref:FISUMP domain-containing protein n=1 Tax=Methanoculleus sp. TaxID=90427 RepID=UPI0025EFE869
MKTINTIKKVSLATLVTFVLSFSSVFAQNDTMYIMKSGAIVGQYNVNTEVDSVIFYKPFSQEQPQTAPIAGFTVSSTSTTTGSNISFTDTSTNTPTIWAWDFGDGSSSTQQNPSHAFSTAGTYMVTLTVSNENGSNTASKSITVTNSGSVSTDTAGTFTDSRDGNDYNWVKIGDQVWMAENLAYLPSVNMVADGSEDAAGSYYYVYGYDGTDVTAAKATANYTTYGVLYNWLAAMNACPDGWHLPSDAEWTELTDYLGGESVAGG